MASNSNTPFGLAPVALTKWSRYYVPQSNTERISVGDPVRSAGGADVDGVLAVKLAITAGAVRGVVVAVEPASPQTGMQGLQKIAVPAVKDRDYYLWVLDDPAATFRLCDDGLTPANLVAANVGKRADLVSVGLQALNGGSAAALLSASFGTGSTVQVLGLAGGLAPNGYGGNGVWVVKFVAHELDVDSALAARYSALQSGVALAAAAVDAMKALRGKDLELLAPILVERKTGIATGVNSLAEQYLRSIKVPSGLLVVGMTVILDYELGRSDAVDAGGAANIRIGTTGTLADVAVGAGNGMANLTGTNRAFGNRHRYLVNSETTLMKLGPGSSASGDHSGGSTSTPLGTSVTVPNLLTNDIYFGVCAQLAAATGTTLPQVGVVSLHIAP